MARRMLLLLVLLIVSLASASVALAQNPPGCYTPRYGLSDQAIWENKVAELEKRSPGSAELAQALEELAERYRQLLPGKAIAALKRALPIREALDGKKNSQSPAETLVRLADAYEAQGDYGEAMNQLDRAEQVTKHDARRTANATMFKVLYSQTNCLSSAQTHDAVRAEQKSKEMVTLAEKLYGPNSAHTYEALSMLYLAYRLLNKQSEAAAVQAHAAAILVKLGNVRVGEGTAQHLDLEPLLRSEESRI